MPMSKQDRSRSLYEFLGVPRNGTFVALRKAYYRRAKECHPDLHPGDPGKAEEFRQVVAAFDVLSEPRTRREYDQELARREAPPRAERFRQYGPSILDSFADDVLEELVVGNEVPRDTTLQTLMLDLTLTRRFITFREAKTRYYHGDLLKAYTLCARLAKVSPYNILYHYYVAESARRLGRLGIARRHYRRCLRLGEVRVPPQTLAHIRRRLEHITDRQGPMGQVVSWLTPRGLRTHIAWREEMTGRLRQYFAEALRRHGPRHTSLLGHRRAGPRRLLPPGPGPAL